MKDFAEPSAVVGVPFGNDDPRQMPVLTQAGPNAAFGAGGPVRPKR
jgi:hypothetical protein